MKNKEKIQEKLQLYKQELKKYKQLFLDDDGKVDSNEQNELDDMLVTIQSIEEILDDGDFSSSGYSEFVIKMKELEKELAKLEKKYL